MIDQYSDMCANSSLSRFVKKILFCLKCVSYMKYVKYSFLKVFLTFLTDRSCFSSRLYLSIPL